MTIISRDELKEYPIGTVFMLYEPEVIDNEVHIKTDGQGFSEMSLTPCEWNYNYTDKNSMFVNWATTDATIGDYDKDQKFVVFSKTEVQHMINILMWALSGCESNLDEDLWICEDTLLHEGTELYFELAEMWSKDGIRW